jgi:hypothetical protein
VIRAFSLAIVALLVLAAPAAAGEQPLERVAADVSFFDADGGRYAVWGVDESESVTVFDPADDSVSSVAKPGGCRSPYAESGGRLLGGAQLMLACGNDVSDPATPFILLDVQTGMVRQLPRSLPEARDASGVLWEKVGRRWVEGVGQCDVGPGRRDTCRVLLEWATGRAVAEAVRPDQLLRDLDARQAPTICGSTGTGLASHESEGQYFLRQSRAGRLRLLRCGRRPDDLGRFNEFGIAGRLVVATSDRSLFAYEWRARRRHRWIVPRPTRISREFGPRPMATRDAAFAVVASREGACDDRVGCIPVAYDVYRARIAP